MKASWLLFYLFIGVFVAGLLVGYFVERTGILYAQSEVNKLRTEVENMQLQEMFIAGSDVDCNLLHSSMGKLSYDLHTLINQLNKGNPESLEFQNEKTQADLLSLRAWILAKNIRRSCVKELLPILYIYSLDCEPCTEQDTILQEIKSRYQNVLVYSIDFNSDEPAIKLVKDAYGVVSAPALIIENKHFGKLSESELESIACVQVNCSITAQTNITAT